MAMAWCLLAEPTPHGPPAEEPPADAPEVAPEEARNLETKKREIRETQLEAERSVLAKRIEIQQQEIAGEVDLEKRNEELTTLRAANAKVDSDSKAYGLSATMQVMGSVDPKVLQALALGSVEPGTLIASAFQAIAERADKIGELNISPDLLQSLTRKAAGSKG